MEKRFVCPVCGEKTLELDIECSFEECDNCHWVMDGVQVIDPNYKNGFNEMSLNEAKQAYKEGKEIH